ncbi:MAG: NAD(P)-dependent alcohol dehydrogenase [Acidimicrobiia bacterium]|nr:NAD(P)-dependent alcohol dehydrogenase [Acidimicrobiia bacterium]
MSTPVAGIAPSSVAASTQTGAAATTPADVAVPDIMAAAVRRRYGAPVEMASIAVPQPAADQVLIRVEAAGIDRGTSHINTGTPYLMRFFGFGLTRPNQPVLGMDLSGTVVAVGDAVTRFGPGDQVFGIGTGTFARYALADSSKLSHKPSGLAHTLAAAVPISAGAAFQALTDIGRLQAGQQVLILGASGGVGSYAVQLAKAFGADVTGVASGPKLDLVRSLGADHVIDYRSADPLDGSASYDLIVDIGGRRPLRHLRRALNPRGTLVITGGEGGNRLTGGIGRQVRAMAWSLVIPQRLTFFIAKEGRESIEALADLLTSGAVAPEVNHVFRLDQVQTALDDLEAGRVRGKAVIDIAAGHRASPAGAGE